MVAQWVSGNTGQFETLDQTYTNSDGPYNLPSPVFITSGSGSGGLMIADLDTPVNADVNDIALGYYGPNSGPNPLQLVSAASVQANADGSNYAIPINLNVGVGQLSIECREDNARLYLALDFASPISASQNLTFSLTDTLGATDGTVASYSRDPSNPDQLDIYLSGVTNGQTLILTVIGVQGQASSISGDYGLELGFLLGDVDGDGAVTGNDFTTFIGNFGKETTATDYLCDFEGDGAIDGNDFTDLITDLGRSLN